MGAFLSTLFQKVEDRTEQRHKEEEEKKKQQRDYWYKAMSDAVKEGDSTGWDIANQNLQKLLSPEAKKGIGKLKETFGKLLPPKGQQQQPAQAQAAQPQGAQGPLQPPPGAMSPEQAARGGEKAESQASSGPLQPPAQQQNPAAARLQAVQSRAADAFQVKQRQEQSEYEGWKKRGEEMGLKDRDLAEYAGSKGQKLPTQPAAATRKPVQIELADGKKVDVQWDPKTGGYFDNKNDPYEFPEGAKIVGKASTARPTIIASDVVKLEDAASLSEQGMPFLGTDGKPIDLSKVPKGMVLQKVHYADGRTLYEPRNIADKVVTVGNERYAVSPLSVQQLPQGAGTDLGVANAGRSGTHEVAAQDALGNPIAQPLQTSTRPVTTGVQGRGAQPPATPAPPAATPSPAPAPPAATPSPATATPKQPAQAQAATPPGSRPLPGFAPGPLEHANARIVPVTEAATQLFGDPTQPDLKPLISFAKLADNPESRKKLGKALKLTFDAFNKASGESHINGNAGPISMSAGGGVIQMIENAFGVPPKLAEQTAGIMQEAIKSLSPEERDAYDATMSAFGTIVGLRSLTKASAAQASVATIEREMPVIGVNTTDSRQFADQMGRLGEIIYNGATTAGVPPSMWEDRKPGFLKRIKELPSEAKKLKDQSNKPSPNGKLAPPGSTVNMKAPDGTVKAVPADQVEYYKSKGATVVK